MILKKYSPIGELSDFAQEYADSLAGETGHAVFVLDRDVIIAVSGLSRQEFMEKQISKEAEEVMESRRPKISDERGIKAFCEECSETDEYSFSTTAMSPIIVEGDPIGVVVISNKEEGQEVGDLELKMANTAASFLAKQMEQ